MESHGGLPSTQSSTIDSSDSAVIAAGSSLSSQNEYTKLSHFHIEAIRKYNGKQIPSQWQKKQNSI